MNGQYVFPRSSFLELFGVTPISSNLMSAKTILMTGINLLKMRKKKNKIPIKRLNPERELEEH